MKKTVLLLALFPAVAFAGDDPLLLESSSVKDGQADVAVDAEIELVFSNNVANQSVKDKNAACISLTQNGKETPAEIIMADDQIQPDLKRIIRVKPKETFKPGQRYELVIKGGLTSKNGNSLGKDTVISFTTQGQAPYVLYIVGACILIIILALIFILRKHGKKKKDH